MNTDNEHLVNCLVKNHACLRRRYRLGGFEDKVSYVRTWLPLPGTLFYELKAEEDEAAEGEISFRKAVENFYRLIEYLKQNCPNVSEEHGVLLLRSRSLVYEACDYATRVPPKLEEYFDEMSERFDSSPRPKDMERWADELNGDRPFARKDEQTKVIKDLLIAALFGANYYYRQHGESAYRQALKLLGKIQKYVVEELPRQHEIERQSFGLIGLTLYLKGRILMAQGSYAKSRVAFRQSAEAYVNRLRQKEELLRDDETKREELREKTSVTLRRAALVTAFGDGYLSFLTSQVTRALEALTLARATLAQNSGRVYLAYVDVWYWACKRAAHSSEEKVIDEVVAGLEDCYRTLEGLVPGSRYTHRTGVQLALALYYKAKLSPQDFNSAFDRAMRLLDEAIGYAGVYKDRNTYKNPHLLGDALIYKSYFLRAHFRSQGRTSQKSELQQDLMAAKEVAMQARDVSASQGTAPLKSEAWAALGSVYTDLVEFRQKRHEDFYEDFDEALKALRQALKENGGENARLDAACYLRLARLCLLNRNTEILAYDYFEQWRKLEGQVEHAYLKGMARELRRKDKIGGPVLVIKSSEGLRYKDWAKKLSEFLLDVTMKQFVASQDGNSFSPEQWRILLGKYMRRKLGYSQHKTNDLIDKKELIEKLMRMRELPTTPDERVRPRSHGTQQKDTK